MWFSITWLAVREEASEKLLQSLGLSPTGETEEFPESLITTARLDTGWRVIWYNKYGCPFLQPQDLSRNSIDHDDVLLCLVEEHVMASSCEMWSGGKRKWWLSHEGESGPTGLSTEGELPVPFPAIRRDMEQLQTAEGDNAGVDYIFDIPSKVAQALVGFKHDEECPH